MRNFGKICSIIVIFIGNLFFAQQTVKRDTIIAGTPLSISMDNRVNDAVKSIENRCNTKDSQTDTIDDSSSKPVVSTPRVTIPEKSKSDADICRQNPRIMGYKIQLAVVKSNEEAKKVGLYFRNRFPYMKVEIDASLRPNYRVMAGSYFRKEGAGSDLKKIKAFFDDARVIQYRIFCIEAK